MNKKMISLVITSTLIISTLSTSLFAKSFDGKQNIDLDHAFTVSFNKALAANQDFSKVTIKDVKGNVVPVTVSIGSDDESITVTPKTNYSPSTNYTLTVDGIKDTAGDNLLDNATMQFTTVSNDGGTTVDPTQERLPLSLTSEQKDKLTAAISKYQSGLITADEVLKIVDNDATDYSTLSYTPQPYTATPATTDQLDTWQYDSFLGENTTDLSKTAGYYSQNVGADSMFATLGWSGDSFTYRHILDNNGDFMYYANSDDAAKAIEANPEIPDLFAVTKEKYPLLYNQIKALYSNWYLTKLNDSTYYKRDVVSLSNSCTDVKASGIPAVNFQLTHHPSKEEIDKGTLAASAVSTLVYLENRDSMRTKYICDDETNYGGETETINPRVDIQINSLSYNEFSDWDKGLSPSQDLDNISQDSLDSIDSSLQALLGIKPATVIYNKYISYLLAKNNGLGLYELSFNYGSIKVKIDDTRIRLWY